MAENLNDVDIQDSLDYIQWDYASNVEEEFEKKTADELREEIKRLRQDNVNLSNKLQKFLNNQVK